MRASVVAINTLASILDTCFALYDFQALKQPKVIASECALATEANRDPEARFKKGTLVVDLNVTAGRFESAYISFNTRTYNGQIPGPTIKVCEGDTLVVNLRNFLGEGSSNFTNLHAHGLEVSSMGQSDNVFVAVEPGHSRQYVYTILRSISDHVYYHPHTHLLVSSQINGLMGGNIFIVENKYHPSYPRQFREMEEVVLLLQGVCYQSCNNNRDNIFNAIINRYGVSETSLLPNELNPDVKIRPENSMIQDTTKIHILLNGQYGPKLHLTTNQCKRLRWTNALANNVVELVIPGCIMYAMGVDGILRKGSPVKKSVNIISPGGRSDIALCCPKAGTYWMYTDSSCSRASQLGLVNDFRAATQKVMEIIVSESATHKVNLIDDFTWTLPYDNQYLVDLRRIPASSIPLANTYNYEFSMDTTTMFVDAKGGQSAYGVNRKTYDEIYINHTMVVGQIQQWQISTKTVPSACQKSTTHCQEILHPFHLHGFPFQIIAKSENLDPDNLLHEIGEYRDTVLLRGGQKIVIRFIPPPFAVGEILTHCHIASHSDNGMAQKVRVIPRKQQNVLSD